VKTSGRKLLGLAVGATVLATIAALCWPEICYRRALPKYRFGVTAETLEREAGVRIFLHKNGNYLPEGEDDLNRRRHFCYNACVFRDYVELDFNDFHELIAITKRTPLAKLGFHERKLHSMFKVPIQ
jgi:hypothetical protein